MRYVSTRGQSPARRFSEILLEGLAPDGGLYVPESYPQVDLAALRALSYPDLAFALVSRFVDDMPDLRAIVDKSYTAKIFGNADITPLKTLEPGLYVLGL